MKLQDVITYCTKLRTRKVPVRFRPQLIYLVDTVGGYTAPMNYGFTSGQTAWMLPSLHFSCYRDAAEFANTLPEHYKAKIVKLNVCAFEEAVKTK